MRRKASRYEVNSSQVQVAGAVGKEGKAAAGQAGFIFS